jgi:hypothetical protein
MYRQGGKKRALTSALQYPMVFEAEIYAIKACASENTNKSYNNSNIYILSGS